MKESRVDLILRRSDEAVAKKKNRMRTLSKACQWGLERDVWELGSGLEGTRPVTTGLRGSSGAVRGEEHRYLNGCIAFYHMLV